MGVSFTGILAFLSLSLLVRPQQLHSFFSGTVQAHVAQFTVPDFQAPTAVVTLTVGEREYSLDVNSSEDQQTQLELTGNEEKSIEVSTNLPFTVLEIMFSAVPNRYQSEPCLVIKNAVNDVLVLDCLEIQDTSPHVVVVPNTAGQDTLSFVSHLLSESVSITVKHQDVAVISAETQLELAVSDTSPVVVSSSLGEFTWIGGKYQFQLSDGEKNGEVQQSSIVLRDEAGNVSEFVLAVYPLPSPEELFYTRYIESNGGYHYLVIQTNGSWWQPLYVHPQTGEIITTTTGTYSTEFPMVRYLEPESFTAGMRPPFITDAIGHQVAVLSEL